jgi:hypothetical protein
VRNGNLLGAGLCEGRRLLKVPECVPSGAFYRSHLSRRVSASSHHRRWQSELVVWQCKGPDPHSPDSTADNTHSLDSTADNSPDSTADNSPGSTADNSRTHLGNSHRSSFYNIFRQPRPGLRTGQKRPRTLPSKSQRNVLSYIIKHACRPEVFENLAFFLMNF